MKRKVAVIDSGINAADPLLAGKRLEIYVMKREKLEIGIFVLKICMEPKL